MHFQVSNYFYKPIGIKNKNKKTNKTTFVHFQVRKQCYKPIYIFKNTYTLSN